MTIHKHGRIGRRMISGLASGLTAMTLMLAASGVALAAPVIHFGVPTWPGVTVQSEVAAQLLEAMGYETEQTNASPAFIISSLRSGRLDVYLGGWMPTEAGLIRPPAKQGEVEILTTNISNALMGLAVPAYVWKAGVHSVADLHKYGDKFGRKIYGIEPGTGFNMAIKAALDEGRHGLGDWHLVQSSTSGMLVQVGRAIENGNWIAFLGWEPHWMNVTYDMKYLTPVGEPEIARTTSDVLTVVNPQLVAKHPEVAQFLTQFQVSKDTMGEWILEYSYKKRDPENVASQWISENLNQVAQWLEGVKALNGKPAIKAVKADYKS